MIFISPKKNKSFTLLELLFVISIFSTSVLAVFGIAQYPLFQSTVSVSRLTAAYLGQEGIELVRNLRDKNWVQSPGGSPPDWDSGLAPLAIPLAIDCSDSGPGCEIDYNDSVLTSYSDSYLKINASSGFYSYDAGGGVDSKFKRKITITSEFDGSVPILKVTSLVFWNDRGTDYTFIAQENLYPWWRK